LAAAHLLEGLSSVRIASGVTEGIYTIWKGEEHFKGNQAPFLQCLRQIDPSADLVWTAWKRFVLTPASDPPWYEALAKRLRFASGGAQVITSAAAIVAAFALFHSSFLSAVDAPDMRDLASHKVVNVLEGDPWDVDFELENTAAHIDCTIDVKTATLVSTSDKLHVWKSEPIGPTPGVKADLGKHLAYLRAGRLTTSEFSDKATEFAAPYNPGRTLPARNK
jgi:hypothetical protein